MALVRAWNTRRQQWQDVPAHYIGSAHIFPGVFVAQPPGEGTPVTKKSRRKTGTAEKTPATTEAAATNEPTPPAGDENKE